MLYIVGPTARHSEKMTSDQKWWELRVAKGFPLSRWLRCCPSLWRRLLIQETKQMMVIPESKHIHIRTYKDLKTHSHTHNKKNHCSIPTSGWGWMVQENSSIPLRLKSSVVFTGGNDQAPLVLVEGRSGPILLCEQQKRWVFRPAAAPGNSWESSVMNWCVFL